MIPRDSQSDRMRLVLRLALIAVALMAFSMPASALPTNNSINMDKNFMEWTGDEAPDLNLSSTGASYVRLSCDNANWNSRNYATVIKDFNLVNGENGCSTSDGNRMVYAQFSDNNATWTASVSDYVRVDTASPTIPKNFKVEQKYGQFEVSWDASDDGDKGIGVAYYKVLKGTGAFSGRAYKTIATTGYTIQRDYEKPETGMTYYYAVVAVDTVGNESGKSEIIPVMYDLNPPVLDVSLRRAVAFGGVYNVTPGMYVLDINSNKALSLIEGNVSLPDNTIKKLLFTGSSTKVTASFEIPPIEGTARLIVNAFDSLNNKAELIMQLRIAAEAPDLNFISPTGDFFEGIVPLKAKSVKAAKMIFYMRNADLKEDWIQVVELESGMAKDYVYSIDLNLLQPIADENIISGSYELKAVAVDPVGNTAEEIKKVYFYNESFERRNIKQAIQELGNLSEGLSKQLSEAKKSYFLPQGLAESMNQADMKLSSAIQAFSANDLNTTKQLLNEARAAYDEVGKTLFEQKGFVSIQDIVSLKAVSGAAAMLLLVLFLIVLASSALAMYKLHQERKYPLKEVKKPNEKRKSLLSFMEKKRLP